MAIILNRSKKDKVLGVGRPPVIGKKAAGKEPNMPSADRFGGGGKGDRVGAGGMMPVTPEGARMGSLYGTEPQQSIDQAKMDAANAPQAMPFNPLQNAVDYAPMGGAPFNPLQNAVDTAPMGGAPFNPLQNAVDTAARPEDLSQRIPPITLQDLIPPVTPQNSLSPMIPPITPGNTSAPTPTPRPVGGGGGAPTPTPRPAPDLATLMGGHGGVPPGSGPFPAAPQQADPRAALVQQMMRNQSPRAQEAGYTTSGVGWPGEEFRHIRPA